MSSFSSILSSIGGPKQAAQQTAASTTTSAPPGQQPRLPSKLTNGTQLTPTNTVAGVKRRSEEPQSAPRPKTARTTSTQDVSSPRPAAVSKAAPPQRQQSSSSPAKPQPPRPQQPTLARNPPSASHPANTTSGPATAKRGFASIMDKAKAAQAAAQAAGPSTIKHQPAPKVLSRRERQRAAEEAKLEAKSRRKAGDRSRSGTPSGIGRTAPPKMAAVSASGYRGTMKSTTTAAKASEAPAYKGTMRPANGPSTTTTKRPPPGKSRQDDYVDWDDMDDAEDYGSDGDEDEGGYGSDASSDMEGGFDDVEKEEQASRRLAQREDQEALAEEDRLKREKEERRRRLSSMNKAAAGKRKY